MKKLMVILILPFLLISCVSKDNDCGNEQVDWQNLKFPKETYCSVPEFFPDSYINYYEKEAKPVCKVHDNNIGIKGTISKEEADKRFYCDLRKRTNLNAPTAYISYWFVSTFH